MMWNMGETCSSGRKRETKKHRGDIWRHLWANLSLMKISVFYAWGNKTYSWCSWACLAQSSGSFLSSLWIKARSSWMHLMSSSTWRGWFRSCADILNVDMLKKVCSASMTAAAREKTKIKCKQIGTKVEAAFQLTEVIRSVWKPWRICLAPRDQWRWSRSFGNLVPEEEARHRRRCTLKWQVELSDAWVPWQQKWKKDHVATFIPLAYMYMSAVYLRLEPPYPSWSSQMLLPLYSKLKFAENVRSFRFSSNSSL